MTAPLILDIGLVLLAAAAGGWLARRIGLPAPAWPGSRAEHCRQT